MIPGMEPAVRENVRTEQMRMLFETPLPGMLLATAFAVALAWQMRGAVPDQTLALWVIAKCVVVLPRIAHALLFARRRSDSLVWLHWGVALLLVDGLTWGAAGVVLVAPDDRSSITMLMASLCAVAAIAAFALQADWMASCAFAASALLPSIGYLLTRGDSFGHYGAGSIAVFLVLLLAAARRSEHHVVELLALRFRNARLTEELTTALARTEQESHAKDVFVANMSHELRTPLHGILGLSRTLVQNLSPADRETLGLIRRSGEHLLGLINNILEFSRFKAHGIDVNPTEVDIVRVVEDAVAMCATNAKERGLSLSTQILLPSPYIAIADPFRVRQIVLNLLGNAIKFTLPGGAVSLKLDQRAQGGVQITVSDTGIGITPEVMTQLFEPFRQGDSSASRQHGGTGLGLHITREICLAMGGDISCRSVLGHGSVFEVVLPLEQVVAGAAAPVNPAGGDSQWGGEIGFNGTSVLLAEDNEVNALVAQATLARYGVRVDHVVSGRGVVQRLCVHGERPDLVLLDCQMPGMDGFEACRRVRAFEQEHALPRIPIVALTANVFQQDRERCLEAGMDAFLGKPFTEHELRQVLATYAGASAGSPAAGP